MTLSRTTRFLLTGWNTAALVLLTILATVSIWAYGPPAPASSASPPTKFSAERARAHIPYLAPSPHPTGSVANDQVRQYLTAELNELGLEVSNQRGRASNDLGTTPYGGQFRSSAEVNNVVGLLAAKPTARPDKDGAILLAAHYDSVPRGRGVHDNAMSVSAVLETVRAITQEPARTRDVYVLFADGEELGLLGSRYFATQHPAMKEITTVINVDSRGGAGPSLMYEAGADSAGLISRYADMAQDARASSLFNALYEFLPNSTDFSELAIEGRSGLNYANIGGFTSYHSPTESLSNLNLRTLQHHGSNVLAGVGAAMDTTNEPGVGDGAVYFTAFGDTFVLYPRWVSLILCVLGAGAALALSCVVARRERLTAADCAWAAGFLAVSTAAVAGVAAVIVRVALGGNAEMAYWGTVATAWPYWAAFAFLAFVVGAWMPHHLPRVRPPAILVVSGSLCAAALVALTMLVPGAEYLALTLAIGYSAALAAQLVSRQPLAWILRIVGVALVCCIFAPTLSLAQDAFGLAGAMLVAPGWGLLATLATVLVRSPDARGKRFDAAAGALIALSVVLAVVLTRGEQRSAQDLLYVHDADTGRSTWAAVNPDTRLWDRVGDGTGTERLNALFPGWTREFATAPATPGTTAAPTVRVTDRQDLGSSQQVDLTVQSTRDAEDGVLLVRGAKVRSFSVGGSPTVTSTPSPRDGWWELWLWANESEPVTVSLTVDQGPFDVIYADRSDGIVGPEAIQSELTAPAIDTAFFTNSTYVTARHRWTGERLIPSAAGSATDTRKAQPDDL
ncbi:MAG: M28 family peptidase [Actinomycetota bacterium]|nr:M28 family peptidase [Actinomycetota bacterium]